MPGIPRPPAWRRVVTMVVTLVACVPASIGAQDDGLQKRVLVLYAMRQESPAYAELERGYRRLLTEGLSGRLDYYSEFVDVGRFEDREYEAAFADFMIRKYRGRHFDLVIANGPTEAAFAARLAPELFPQAPIVFNGTSLRPIPNSTGFSYRFPMKETLDLALRVHPATRRVFVVGGSSAFDEYYERTFREQLGTRPTGVELVYLIGLPLPALLEKLGSLPADSVVMFLSFGRDSAGNRYVPTEALERIAAAAAAPAYCWIDLMLGRGVLGGRMIRLENILRETTDLALRVLRGERADTIPVTAVDVSEDVVDWRQLRRWNIHDDRVPSHAQVLFREPGLFERYRAYVIGTTALVSLQAVMIAGLLLQRQRRRRAERSLAESEDRFRVMADTAPVMVWRSGIDQRCDFFNRPWLDFRGRTFEEEAGDGWMEGLHPEDRDLCVQTYTNAFATREPFRIEYRLQRADGEYRWVLDTGVPRLTADGSFAGYIGSCLDITERRMAEQTLRDNEAALRQSHARVQDLAGRLITAQEDERARIARELHDDVGQQLAGLSLALSACKRRPELQASEDLRHALASLQRRTIDLAEDIRLLSHHLHPGALRHAGLVDTLQSHCVEFGRQNGLNVTFDVESDPGDLDLPTALCLYRVAQESLRNIAKHAGAQHVQVALARNDGDVRLAIADDGRGFDLAGVRRQRSGLGLQSIDERVRLAGGRVTVDTKPNRGTRVTVWVKASHEPATGCATV